MEAWDPILRNESDDSSSSDDEDELENKGSLNGDSNYNDKEINRVSKSNCMNRDARASKVLSEDPFNLYEILNKTKESSSISKEDDLKYPPGFTPKVVTVEEAEAKDTEVIVEKVGLDGRIGKGLGHKAKKGLWGNSSYDYAFSSSLGNSGGILCVWEPSLFHKDNITSFDYFLAVMGTWIPTYSKLLIISVYAPQELTEKRELWD
ncbi:hypothetical protein Tco_0904979 [Tanacetum coccineum]